MVPKRMSTALFLAASLLSAPVAQTSPRETAEVVVAAARAQVGVTVIYDGSYRRIPYPGGDVPMERGVCTDVLIRAFRAADLDLQVLVHEDMVRAFDRYPHLWGLTRPDPNIDHRRVPNLAAYFRRHAVVLTPDADPAGYLPADVVTWRLPSGVPHIGLVSTAVAGRTGRRLVLHNIGEGTREEDVLFAWPVTGHYRYVH